MKPLLTASLAQNGVQYHQHKMSRLHLLEAISGILYMTKVLFNKTNIK